MPCFAVLIEDILGVWWSGKNLSAVNEVEVCKTGKIDVWGSLVIKHKSNSSSRPESPVGILVRPLPSVDGRECKSGPAH